MDDPPSSPHFFFVLQLGGSQYNSGEIFMFEDLTDPPEIWGGDLGYWVASWRFYPPTRVVYGLKLGD